VSAFAGKANEVGLLDVWHRAKRARKGMLTISRENSLLRTWNSLLFGKISLIVYVGNLLKSACGTVVSCVRIVAPRMDLPGFEPAGLIIEVSQIIIHKADEPNAVVGLLDADGLAGEHLTEIDPVVIEADAAAGGDGGCFIVKRIVEIRQAAIWP
jgi:hypothetical protein